MAALGSLECSCIQTRMLSAQQHGCPLGNALQRKRVKSEGRCQKDGPQNCGEHGVPVAGCYPSQALCALEGAVVWQADVVGRLELLSPFAEGLRCAGEAQTTACSLCFPYTCAKVEVCLCATQRACGFYSVGDLLSSCALHMLGINRKVCSQSSLLDHPV